MEQYNNQNNNPDAPYWVRRIQEANSRNLKRTNAQTEEALKQLYQEQGEKLYQQLLDVFVKLDSDSQDGKIYTNDLFRTNNYYQLIQYFNDCSKTIGGQQVEITESALIRTYEYARSVVEGYAPKGIIQPGFVIPSATTPKQAINQTWCLDGKEFSDRIWQNKKALIKDLAGTMADFTSRGENAFTLAKEITKRLQVDLYSAYRIARTETAHAQIKGQTDKYKELGFTQARWLATDGCDECQALDGQLFNLDEIQWMIPRHPNCECSFLLEVGE